MKIVAIYQAALFFAFYEAKVQFATRFALGPCINGICDSGFECIDDICRKEPDDLSGIRRSGSKRTKRDTGLPCRTGGQAASLCFPPTFCGPVGSGYTGPGYTGSGCCGGSGYHCENGGYGNICCPDSGMLVTVRPTPTIPIIPCIGQNCGQTAPTPQQNLCPHTHIDRGMCSPTDYAWCSMNGFGECINGRCCQKIANTVGPQWQGDNCVPHYVPQFGQTLLLCPDGKICRNNKCIAADCQPTTTSSGCPVGKREIGLCHPKAVNYQECSNGATCHEGKCCQSVTVTPPIVSPIGPPPPPQPSMCTPYVPAHCANPYNYVRNNCCRKKK